MLELTQDSPENRQAIETGATKAMLYRVSAVLQEHSAIIKSMQKNREVRGKLYLPLLEYIFLPLLHSADQNEVLKLFSSLQ